MPRPPRPEEPPEPLEQDTLELPAASSDGAKSGPRRRAFTPLDLAPVRAHYEGATEPAVVRHLAEHPQVIAALLDAAPHLRSLFGAAARLHLEAALFAGGKLSARVVGHGLATDEADVRVAMFTAWWRVALPAHEGATPWLEFCAG